MNGYADAVERLLTSLDVDNPHVVGNSMGAAIATELGNRGVARSVTAFSPIGFAGRAGLPGCGHLPFPDDPAACAAAVLQTTEAA